MRAPLTPVVMAVCIWLSGTAIARADALDTVTVHWSGTADCDDAAPARREALRLLPAAGQYGATEIHVRVEAVGTRYRVVFRAQQQQRSADRKLDVADCAEAQRAAGLLIALTLDPLAAMEASAAPADSPADTGDAGLDTDASSAAPAGPVPGPAAAPVPVAITGPGTGPGAGPGAQPTPAGPPASEPTATRDPYWRGASVSLRLPIDVGVLPSFAVGVGGSIEGMLRWGSVGLAAGYLAPVAARELDASVGGQVDAALSWASLEGCGRLWRFASGSLSGCGALDAGRYAAESAGVTDARSDRTLWLATSLSLRTALRLSRAFAFELALGPLFPMRRPVLHVEGQGAVHTVPVVAMRGAMALSYRFGR